MIPTKQEILNELSRLYKLQEEGKKVKAAIQVLEKLLQRYHLGEKKTNEKNQKGW